MGRLRFVTKLSGLVGRTNGNSFVRFNPEKIVHFLTWSGLQVTVAQRRPSFVIEFGEPRRKKPLDQPTAILTNIFDSEQHFFTPEVNC